MDVSFHRSVIQCLADFLFLIDMISTVTTISSTVYKRFVADRCLRIAGALSFTTLLALVPLLTVGLAAASWFPAFQLWTSAFEDFLYKNFVPATGDVIRIYLQQFAARAAQLTAFGLILLAISALFLFATIEDTFNDIWRVRRGRNLAQRVLVYSLVLTVGPLLIGASLTMTYYLLSVPLPVADHGVRGVLYRFLPWFFETMAFILLFFATPNCSVRVWHALIAGCVAGALFELSKRGFSTFVANFANYETIYGALAVVPIFLVWIYVSWLVVLIGAELTAELQHHRTAQATTMTDKRHD